MMIAVLIDSRKVGESGWINVRSSQTLRIQGMQEGDEVRLHNVVKEGPLPVFEDQEIAIGNGRANTAVKAEIVKISEDSHIYVDLE